MIAGIFSNLLHYLKKETVLCAALLLAVVSACVVVPDRAYLNYIDFRTLAILFCLMSVMAGMKKIGVFDKIAQELLRKVKSRRQVQLILVALCFFFSMLITNDVALITFVPFTFIVLKRIPKGEGLIVPVVALQTAAANLGSMLTPIGNPQNLYLYGKASLSPGQFLWLMLPYTLLALLLLLAACLMWNSRERQAVKPQSADRNEQAAVQKGADGKGQAATLQSVDRDEQAVVQKGADGKGQAATPQSADRNELSLQLGEAVSMRGKERQLGCYLLLFVVCLLTVARVLPWGMMLGVTAAGIFFTDKKVFAAVDYSLLLTFVGFFVFIGNMGRIPAFCTLLSGLLAGHEVVTSVAASQIISNVPAALLLSGFTTDYRALIIGTNLGGLGTLIASMASLISYKYVAAQAPERKGRYLVAFTVLNVILLAAELTLWQVLGYSY